ncbi:unnamed protein product [Callosobruchus maculatus]|uniref:Uncharacterized protein n=1 Tax=Callosobruchus maculatus TaxID=64391 RepID=A0A653C805_CALMS|nr:unnamed protein product [Callosobruchus maculatus]
MSGYRGHSLPRLSSAYLMFMPAVLQSSPPPADSCRSNRHVPQKDTAVPGPLNPLYFRKNKTACFDTYSNSPPLTKLYKLGMNQ